MEYVDSFSDLQVYKLVRNAAHEIFIASQKFPEEEKYSLTDQIRRSSRSIGAQIAEAWAKRGYEKHFVSKLTDADGEQLETQHWIETACQCRYVSEEQAKKWIEEYAIIGKMINSMMIKSSAFCKDDQ